MNTRCIDALDALRREVAVEIVETKQVLREAQTLRHIVFCKERDILPSKGAYEADEYDDRSRHIVLRRRTCGELIGTVRLVVPEQTAKDGHLPMAKVAPPAMFEHLPLSTTAEISRFGLSRDRRDPKRVSDPIMGLGLMQGILTVSRELGLTHWCAAMEPGLLRLLRSVCIHFEGHGPLVEYCGLRQPSVACIDTVLERGRNEKPDIWAFVTGADRHATCDTGMALAA